MARDSATAFIILTAGRSSRMGEPKALLRFGKRTALEVAVSNAVEAGVRRLVTVVGYRAEEIRSAHSFTGLPSEFRWVVNHDVDSPMIVSLQTGLHSLSPYLLDAFLFQPVDVPLVTAGDIRALITAHSERKEGETVFIPSHEEHGGHPVLCDASLIPDFLALDRGATARDVIRGQAVVYVETGNPGVLEDMDTRDDYRRLRGIFEARGGGGSPASIENLRRGLFPGSGTMPEPRGGR